MCAQEDQNSLWLMGNQFISSAREIYSNHALLANTTVEDLLLNRDWQYINKNGPAYITAG